MDIRDFETRHLIKTGLAKINNPFLKTMIAKNAIKIPEVNNLAIAFYVAPYVNAVCRTGTIEEKKLLFESMLEWKAYKEVPSSKRGAKLGETEILVEQAVRVCSNVKARQARQKDKLAETLEEKIQNENLLDHKILTICSEESYGGLAGLVCNEYVAKYKRPTLLLSKNGNEYIGSSRGYEKSELKNFKEFLESCPYVNWAQGHNNANGCCISEDNISNFIKWSDEALKDIDFSEEYLVDFITEGNNFNPNFIYDVCNLNSIYGQNIDEPLVAVTNLKITKDNLQLLSRDKNPTIKINLPNGVCLMKFKSNEEEYEQLYSESGCTIIDIIAKCNINEYQGKTTPQLFIESYNIISRQEYYF